jgi:hypothetical protein
VEGATIVGGGDDDSDDEELNGGEVKTPELDAADA